MKQFKRHETAFTIATLWEFKSLGKINLDPQYQRSSKVWSEEKQSFLIDSLVKNFPIPPIFLHEFIDQDSGKTKYDVIDGKQRLTSIFKFIEGQLTLPDDCSEDGYCEELLNGTSFKNWENDDYANVKREFWQYQINIVFIDSDEEKTINDVFDRLNRNGEPLTAQEFRKAMYNNDSLYSLFTEFPSISPFDKILSRLDKNRYEDVEYCSELFFSIAEGKVIDSNKGQLDELYTKYFNENRLDTNAQSILEKKYRDTASILNSLISDMQLYYKTSVSHIYAMWMLAYYICKSGKNASLYIKSFNEFYVKVKKKDTDVYIQKYIQSMQQSTKSLGSRKKRFDALLGYMQEHVENVTIATRN